MEAAVVTRRSRESSPGDVDDTLSALWRDVARETPVARALMANLIVLREAPAAGDLGIPLDEVMRRHPSRVIVLRHALGQAKICGPSSASVSILTFGPSHARYGVEEIVVRSACADASLPSIVRRLTRGDVPASLWWAEDLSRVAPIRALTEMARQLVFDSRQWRDVHGAVRALAPLLDDPDAPELADVNWRRLTSMRYAVVHAASTMLPGARTLERVEVHHRPGERALAWLLVGWLAARLRWPDGPRKATIREVRHNDDVLSVTCDGIVISMNASRIVAKSEKGRLAFQVAARQESVADAVIAELSTLAPDRCLPDALRALAAGL